MTGNRMSALPVTEFCGAYHQVVNASGRAAVMGTAFHARCSKAEDAEAKWHRLTPEEQEEVSTWHEPTAAEFESGAKLLYVDADTELEVGLTQHGEYCSADDPRCISVGHLDMAWVYEGVAYVADIKKSQFTSENDSLQLHAYGFAYAAMKGCHSYCLGLWIAEDGVWDWGPIRSFDDDETVTTWLRIKHAALNKGTEYSLGAHCRKCYGRFRCPAYLFPPSAAGELAKMATQENLGPGEWAALLCAAQRAKDTAEDIIKQAKDRAAILGPLADGAGFIFKGSLVRGRETLDRDALGKVVDLKKYTKRGADYERFAWVKEK